MLIQGMETHLIIVILLVITILYTANLAKEGRINPKIRRLPALDAIEEGVGRAAEMGRPVQFTTGIFSITAGGLGGFPAVMAGVSCLRYVAELCAKQGVRLIDSIGKADKYSLEYETIKEAYLTAGTPESFRGDDIRYLSDTQHAFSAGFLDTVHSEEVATNIMIGGFAGEATMIAEGSQAAGCFQIGGNPRTSQMYFFVVICDYALIGEEVYSAGAVLRQIPEELGTLFGQDIMRYVGMAMIGIGALMSALNIDWLFNLL